MGKNIIIKTHFLQLFLLILFSTMTIHSSDLSKKILSEIATKSDLEKIILLDKAIDIYKNEKDLYLEKAKLEFNNRDFIGAKNTILKAKNNGIILDKDFLSIIAISLYNIKDYNESYKYFSQILSIDKNDRLSQFYLNLIQDKVTIDDYKYPIPDIKELDKKYLTEVPNDRSNYLFLYQGRLVNIVSKNNIEISNVGIIKINNIKRSQDIKRYTFSFFDNYEISNIETYIVSSENYEKQNRKITYQVEEINEKDYQIMKKITFSIDELKDKDIFVFNIRLKTNEKYNFDGWSYFYSFLATDSVLCKELIIRNPKNISTNSVIKGLENQPEEIIDNTNTKLKKYTVFYPRYYDLYNDNYPLNGIDYYIYLSTTNFDNIYNFYNNSFYKNYDNKNKKVINLLKEIKKGKDVEETIKNVYEYVRKNFKVKGEAFPLIISPANINTTIDKKEGNSISIVYLYKHIFDNLNIETYPIITSTYNNGFINIDTPDITFFNKILLYIPSKKYFIDPYKNFSSYKDIQYDIQDSNGIVLYNKDLYNKDNKKDYFIKIPYTENSYSANIEYFKLNVNEFGEADVEYNSKITGLFANIAREKYIGNDSINDKEKIKNNIIEDYKGLFTNLKNDEITIKNIDDIYSNLEININTKNVKFTQLMYDGSQNINFNLSEIVNLINVPRFINFPYRKNFLFTFSKEYTITFPENFTVISNNVQNFYRNNKYYTIELFIDKIKENQIFLKYYVKLNSLYINPEDTNIINQTLNSLRNNNYTITLKSTEKLDLEKFYNEILKKYDSVETYKNYIARLYEADMLDKAIELAKEGKTKYPEESYFPITLMLLYNEKKEYDLAEKEIEYALEIENDENRENTLSYAINFYKSQSNSSRYIETLNKAISEYPTKVAYIFELSDYYVKTNQLDLAIELLKDKTNQITDNSDIPGQLGYLYLTIKDYKNAEFYLKKSIEINRENAYSMNNLSWLYCETNTNIDEAINLAENAVFLVPDNYNFFDTLAEAYYLKGNYQKALQAIDKAIELNNSSEYLHKQREKILKAYQKTKK